MSDVILQVENVSKQYRLGTVGTGTISHDLNRLLAKIRGKEDPFLKVGEVNDRSAKDDSQYVWALKDISFEVKRGEVLGIIGKNGAGKSTLLKILSKVTGPTQGNIRSKGRIASLLEVGTGFHPEMTGKENIYLNGAILGMTKKEIAAKIDEIVEFSGCERYIDTPVKRYSSGMRVRLAFAVAAHLEPDILVVDEVLAVGDIEFQRKAVGKMKNISDEDGRTVLFVSHNMESILKLCTKAMILENGKVLLPKTDAKEAVRYYLNAEKEKLKIIDNLNWSMDEAPGNDNIRILNIKVKPTTGGLITISSGFIVEYTFFNKKKDINLGTTIEIQNINDVVLVHQGHRVAYDDNKSKEGIYKVTFHFQPFIFNTGKLKINLIFGENSAYGLFRIDGILGFDIAFEPVGIMTKTLPGIICPNLNPQSEFLEE